MRIRLPVCSYRRLASRTSVSYTVVRCVCLWGRQFAAGDRLDEFLPEWSVVHCGSLALGAVGWRDVEWIDAGRGGRLYRRCRLKGRARSFALCAFAPLSTVYRRSLGLYSTRYVKSHAASSNAGTLCNHASFYILNNVGGWRYLDCSLAWGQF